MNMHGYYIIEVTNSKTGVTQTVEQTNLITSNGRLDMVSDANFALTAIQVGTGTVTPTVASTALTTPISVSKPVTSTTTASYTGGYTRTFTSVFSTGEVVGNISEVGIGYGGSATTNAPLELFSHALLKNPDGQVITLPVTAADTLTIRYVLRYSYLTSGSLTSSIGEVTFSYSFLQVNTSVVPVVGSRFTLSDITAHETALSAGNTTGLPSGGASAQSFTVGTPTVTGGEVNIPVTWNYTASQANFTNGIGAFVLHTSMGAIQMKVTPSIDKTSDTVLTMNATLSLANAL